jgi:glycosyltransferase involved in cell wall biosynthesis
MGGKSAEIIAKDKNYLKFVANYKKIYVEANGMKKELEDKGLRNVGIFPNCRSLPKNDLNVNEAIDNKIRLVYFSQISEEKGADLVFEAANLLDRNEIEYEIDFYGPINEKFEEKFFSNIDNFSNVKYCGIFKADEEDVYEKLNQYDVLLFPTRWKHEGVPGILVEAKIAGIPSIVSQINFNAEIINDGSDGIVMNENSAPHLFNAINLLYSNRELLSMMKYNAKGDSINYLIDNYINNIISDIRGERN